MTSISGHIRHWPGTGGQHFPEAVADPWGDDQYQLSACECAQAAHGVPYTPLM